ncbi:serine/threonine-protein phosphatase 6 regulatory subunit 3-B [Lutzomyia longipalpis]|uniref:serine/threonine-protein phosphatase 6 regulatory subunit 3-B n=1 Tax=Lutzomyia longipalpis TaxID=7200 RepID=UPI00248444F9|nr:serine/threonine-protein phosphatase 6 regulatory subunit 3-B [Lutzomyia longipalpis]XP_055690525.1 serine/threonine-protein phosphatase 6 regulatory subunit 3-B [Lutzomyia longipalpis]XP_055690526.1 serine/threonine-protein phosphatase 6 regulatory subunit 3-B [Lutzomyia longipalpis]
MYWDGSYTPSQHFEALLNRKNLTLLEILEDQDILQECRTQNPKLVQFLNRPDILEELVTLITTEPPTDVAESERFKHSNLACEILTSDMPSLNQSLVADPVILQKLYSFLEQKPPLNPLLMSFFCKTFGMLIDRKQHQDWFAYQYVCITVLDFIKSRTDFLGTILQHMGTPVIMDLLLYIIMNTQGPELRQSLLEWFNQQKLIERLIGALGMVGDREKHENIAQFVVEYIREGRRKRQSEKEEGNQVDLLLETLEDEKTTELLLRTILDGENQNDGNIVAGITIILALIEYLATNELSDDSAVQYLVNKEKEHHSIVVGKILGVLKGHIGKFHDLLLKPPDMSPMLQEANVSILPAFGNTRLQICCLFTVLIETQDSDIINAICATDFFNTLLNLFKQYCWNNFLHNHVNKCLRYALNAFDTGVSTENYKTVLNLSALQKHVVVDCKVVSKLLDCWMYNESERETNQGRRLGYMGHLIQILDSLVSSYTMSEELRALIDSTLEEDELVLWRKITAVDDGELTEEINMQKRFLADHNPFQANNNVGPKDFYNEASNTFNDFGDTMHSAIDEMPNAIENIFSAYISSDLSSSILNNLKVWPDDEILACDSEDFESAWAKDDDAKDASALTFTNPWDSEATPIADDVKVCDSGWANFSSDNFADFDTHFSHITGSGNGVDAFPSPTDDDDDDDGGDKEVAPLEDNQKDVEVNDGGEAETSGTVTDKKEDEADEEKEEKEEDVGSVVENIPSVEEGNKMPIQTDSTITEDKTCDENAKNGDNSHTSEEATDVPLNAATESTNDGEIGNSAEEPKSNENSADEILPSNGPSDSIDVELKNCNNNEINDCKSQPTSNKTAIVATAVDENNATSFVENGPA